MITVALAHLLDRGVRLTISEALAVTQLVALAPGRAAIDNVEISSDGSVACMNRSGEPSVAALATLLHAILPAEGVPAPLRYAVARGMGAVTAPAFVSIGEFSESLRRFEVGDRTGAIRDLLARAAHGLPPVSALPAATVRPAVAVRPIAVRASNVTRPVAEARRGSGATARPLAPVTGDPAGAVELERPTIPPPVVVRHRVSRVALAVALLLLSGLAGFAAMESRRSPVFARTASSWMSHVSGTWISRVPPQWLSRLRGAVHATRSTPKESVPESVQPPGRDSADAARVSTPAVPRVAATSGSKSRTPVRALPPSAEPAFSPAFSASGTALFFQTGGTGDRSSAIEVVSAKSWPADDLRIMTVVDDGARNYHAQPSPDGRLIAFDSDRDGERGVYVAGSDGSNVRRVSGRGYAALPTWAPDGTRLAYVRAEESRPSVWNLWIQPLDGGPARRVTDYRFGQTWSASWFPDGRRVAYSHEDTLTILDLETGRARHFGAPVRGHLIRTPAVSPDGSRVVFQVFRAGAWMLNLEDGSMECVLSDPTAEEFAWAPDGHRFAFHSRRDGQWSVYVLSGLGSAH